MPSGRNRDAHGNPGVMPRGAVRVAQYNRTHRLNGGLGFGKFCGSFAGFAYAF